ncbi:unnamed protein product [Rhizoctonia solani]|uniref:Uncharacterized protein n=1 Tax=Rhizoctonia solani TaxID=456999 RepID=A0A8H3B3S2_9AGAM|nr:unnamed protein product [Rhizoctonia solani]
MKRAVPSSPTQNPKPAKTNMARVTTTQPIPSTPQDRQVPAEDAAVDNIGDLVGGGVEPSSGVVTTPEAARDEAMTASKTPATKSGVQKVSNANSVIVDDDDDAEWVDEDEVAEDDETDSSSSGSDDDEYLFTVQAKRASKEKWSTVPTMGRTKATVYELGAFQDMEALSDALLNKVAHKTKLSIARYRAEEAACLAETRDIESHIKDITDQMEYEAGLTPLELVVYRKTQLEEAMTRRLAEEYQVTQLKQETLELRYKMLQLHKTPNDFLDELPQFVDSDQDPRIEQVLRDTRRLLGADFA